MFGGLRIGVGIRSVLNTQLQSQHVDCAKKLFAPVGERCAGDSAESFMIRRKIWLHYHTIRLSVEILAIFGTAALIGYWIVQTSR